MADHPILFSGTMVRALLAGHKTQTRRVLKPQPDWLPEVKRTIVDGLVWPIGALGQQCGGPLKLPRFAVGDRLYVRETGIRLGNAVDDGREQDGYEICGFRYAADGATIYLPGKFEGHDYERLRASIHMPRWASRLTLTVTDVKVERLKDISRDDAIAEGLEWVAPTYGIGGLASSWSGDPRISYAALWDEINGSGAWDKNPWVAATTFSVHHGNIDARTDNVDNR